MFKILAKRTYNSPIVVLLGDTVELVYQPHNIDEPARRLSTNIEKKTEIDTLIIFELDGELGLETGIGGVFGKELK
jgi:hypothetical protein